LVILHNVITQSVGRGFPDAPRFTIYCYVTYGVSLRPYGVSEMPRPT